MEAAMPVAQFFVVHVATYTIRGSAARSYAFGEMPMQAMTTVVTSLETYVKTNMVNCSF